MIGPDTPLSTLHGVGPTVAKRLRALGLSTLSDLVWWIPRGYDDRSHITDCIDVATDVEVTVRVRLEKITARKAFRRKRMSITEALFTDDTGSVRAVWFNQPYVADALHVDDTVMLSGVAKKSTYGLALQNPVYEKVQPHKTTTHTGRIVPRYNLTHGVTQKQMRYFVQQALKQLLPIDDHLPERLRNNHQLLALTDALQQVHFPDSFETYEQALRRLNFDELFFIQLHGRLLQEQLQHEQAPSLAFQQQPMHTFVESLPFALTAAQKKAAWEVLQDLERPTPMNRLLVGDVGSGKTIVAAMALYSAVLNGYQAALMAPTEILAKQHAHTLRTLFAPLGITVELHTSSTRNTRTPQSLLTAPVLVGTHALIQDTVQFKRLGLAVVDEQHRFGVAQRKALKDHAADNAYTPHLLSMSATPIPRTLALTLYGDLALSCINELPPGRIPVITKCVPVEKREAAYGFIRTHIAAGEQAFVICPLIEPSDTLGVRSVSSEYDRLHTEVFPDLRVALLHGKMKPAEKEEIMERMRSGAIDLLVATSVIEVGVDIPNATMMLIEGAERFGLAQLHQFRGRVGRSDKQSYCFLFSDQPGAEHNKRLQALTHSTDGFALAELDLQLRGAGELYGLDQTGFSGITQLAFSYPQLLEDARRAVDDCLQNDDLQQFTPLQQRFNLFLQQIHFE